MEAYVVCYLVSAFIAGILVGKVISNQKHEIDSDVRRMRGYIELIKYSHKLESHGNDLYRFCMDACQEIHKYTGEHVWHEKLDRIVKGHSE